MEREWGLVNYEDYKDIPCTTNGLRRKTNALCSFIIRQTGGLCLGRGATEAFWDTLYNTDEERGLRQNLKLVLPIAKDHMDSPGGRNAVLSGASFILLAHTMSDKTIIDVTLTKFTTMN